MPPVPPVPTSSIILQDTLPSPVSTRRALQHYSPILNGLLSSLVSDAYLSIPKVRSELSALVTVWLYVHERKRT